MHVCRENSPHGLCMQNGGGGDDNSPPEDDQADAEEGRAVEENIVTTAPREVYIVNSVPQAQAALERLQAIQAANPNTIFACDTEVRHCCSRLARQHITSAAKHLCVYTALSLAWPADAAASCRRTSPAECCWMMCS